MNEQSDKNGGGTPTELEGEMAKTLKESEVLVGELADLEREAEELLDRAGNALEHVVEDSQKES